MPAVRRLTAFSSRFADNQQSAISQIYSALPARAGDGEPNALNLPLVVAVQQTTPRSVAAFDVNSGRKVWEQQLDAQSAPEILGDTVVVSIGPRAVALDLRTGQRKWDYDLRALAFQGAARDGNSIVLVASIGATGGARVGRVAAVNADSGGERWNHQVVGILGRPAAAAGRAFVPWDRQSLAVLDLNTGVEQARVRATDDVLGWVFAGSQGVYYGSRGAYRWTPRSASGTRAGSAYMAVPVEDVPGDPPLYRDAFAGSTGGRTARDKIRFAFLPRSEGDGLAVAHGTVFLVYYRFVVAFDAQTGAVKWARSVGPDEANANASDAAAEAQRRAQAQMSQFDIENITVTNTSVVVVSGNGRLRALDPATGAIQGQIDLNANIGAISTDLVGFRPPATGSAPAPEGSTRDQLVALIRDADNRLVPIRAFLVKILAKDQAPEVTGDLLDLYRARAIPAALRQEVATALRARETGQRYLIEAIDGDEDHYNFLENRQAPPLDVIAPTLASMGAREAVPLLLQHLLDHETPTQWLPVIVDAVVTLEDPNAVPQLQAFVQRYRSDSAFSGDRGAPLVSAVTGIFKLGDATARQWLTAMQADAAAHQSIRDGITRLFTDEARGAQGQSDEQRLSQAREQLQGRVNALRAAVNAFPVQLTQEQFDDEWNNHLDDLRACAQGVLTRRPDLNEIRITVTVRSEPASSLFETTPPPVRLPNDANIDLRLQAIQNQQDWVERQMNALEAAESSVRTVVFSPQDPEMSRCMSAIILPIKLPGFGRTISTRQIVQRISTVRATARQTITPGFGTPPGTNVLVPWFLVSSPSMDSSGMLVQTAPTGTPTTNTGPAVNTGNGPPVIPGTGGPPVLPGSGGPPALPGSNSGVRPSGPPAVPGGPPVLPGAGGPPALPNTPPPANSNNRPPTNPNGPPANPGNGPPTPPGGTPPTNGTGNRPWWEEN
jgi:outer membrane protein assembly factor BamB